MTKRNQIDPCTMVAKSWQGNVGSKIRTTLTDKLDEIASAIDHISEIIYAYLGD